jgi:hypothetical protein
MKGYAKGVNFHTSANKHFGKASKPTSVAVRPHARKYAAGGSVKMDPSSVNEKDAMSGLGIDSADKQPVKEVAGMMAHAEKGSDNPVKVGKVLKQASDAMDKLEPQKFSKGGAVCSPAKVQTVAAKEVAKHVARPAPKGHKGLKKS